MKADEYSLNVWCAAAWASALVCAFAFSSSAATNDIFGGTYANWPSTWTELSSLNDPIDAGIEGKLDFVGDTSNPGAYYNYSVASPKDA